MRRHWLSPAVVLWLVLIGVEFWQWCAWGGEVVAAFCTRSPCPPGLVSTAAPAGLPWLSGLLAAGTVGLGFGLARTRSAGLLWLGLAGAALPVIEVLIEIGRTGGAGSAEGVLLAAIAVLVTACATAALGLALLGLGSFLGSLRRT